MHSLKGYIATLYLVEYPDRLLLLDGGARRDAARLVDFLRTELKRSPEDLALSLVTHMHLDHAGGAPRLRHRYGVPIAAHYRIDCWYRGFSGALQHLVDTLLGHYSARRQFGHVERAWSPRILRPNYLLHDGETLPGFPDWIAYEAPGHTLYDLVFFQPGQGLLYVGDLMIKSGGRVLLPFPTLFPRLMAATFAKMGRLPIRKLLMAHGGEHEIADPPAFFAALGRQLEQPPDKFQFRLIKPLLLLGRETRRPR